MKSAYFDSILPQGFSSRAWFLSGLWNNSMFILDCFRTFCLVLHLPLFAVFRLPWKVCFGLLFTHCSNLNQFEEVKPGYCVVATPWTSHVVSYSLDNISFAVIQVPGLRDKWSWFFCNDHTKGIPLSQDEPLKICIIWGNVLPLALGVCTPHRLYFSSVWARSVETGVESLKPLQSEQDLDLLLPEKVLLFLCVCRPTVSPFSRICKISHHLPVNSDTPSLWPWTACEAWGTPKLQFSGEVTFPLSLGLLSGGSQRPCTLQVAPHRCTWCA